MKQPRSGFDRGQCQCRSWGRLATRVAVFSSSTPAGVFLYFIESDKSAPAWKQLGGCAVLLSALMMYPADLYTQGLMASCVSVALYGSPLVTVCPHVQCFTDSAADPRGFEGRWHRQRRCGAAPRGGSHRQLPSTKGTRPLHSFRVLCSAR